MLKTYNTYYGVAFITAPKIDTELLWGLSIFFTGLALVYFAFIFFFRNRITSTAALTKQRKKELSPMISEFLFHEEDADKGEKSNYISLKIEIRELLKDNFNRKILVEVLMDLRKDVSGDTQIRLFNLYQDLGLEKDAFDKLKSWHWEIVSKGILELTQMRVETAYGFITKFINHRKSTIRKQAEIATVTLKPEGINYFLDTTRYRISEWQQLKLLDVIRNQENFQPPRFRMWLTSKNKHVVLFALRLIKYYNQNDANTSLIELVKHKDNQIRNEAIGCIKEFYVVESIPTLKAVFKKCNTDSKIAVLGAIADLGSIEDIGFLKTSARNESNFSVSSKALAAINTIAPDTVMPYENIEKSKAYIADFEEEIPPKNIENVEKSLPEIVQAPIKKVEEMQETGNIENLELNHVLEEQKNDQTIRPLENSEEEDIQIDRLSDVIAQETKDEEHLEEEKEVQLQVIKNIPPNAEHKVPSPKKIEVTEITEMMVIDPVIVTFIHKELTSAGGETFSKSSLRFDFLPIVTITETHLNQTITKYKPMADSDNSSLDIRSIDVEYEIVSSTTGTKAPPEHLDFDISTVDFLPIVIDGKNEVEVYNEEVSTDQTDIKDSPELLNEVNELDFLPIVMDNEVLDEQVVPDENTEIKDSEDLNSLEGYTLSDFEVQFENTENLEPIENEEISEEENDMDEPHIVKGSEDVISWLMAENELRDIETEDSTKPYADLIPEPIYYNEHEAYMMGLLDDLEEMGDHREVPLLQELLAEENKSFIKDRINSLIERFSYTGNGNKTISEPLEEPTIDLPAFNVFADLFKNIDDESKMVLLDEIVYVGDEKEIAFLDTLLDSSNLKIRERAQEVLKLLVEKVSRKTEFEKDLLPKPVGELPIDLSLLEPFDDSKSKKKNIPLQKPVTSAQDTLISDFDFELIDTEVLDKKYDEKVLDIEVEVTEVGLDESSFFTSIRDLPRKLIGKLNG
ncbi:HEAT repeat domain-containing protein [Zobellia uliginosa]|uniref:HEAT repeat domain-containing protein n=1 Tax=Zobellia uliginosa TaxID=143224 RepID=UPI001C075B08|nr:HEAT repeat domain-containing protein [Zobellia uliginosa]MBU2946422.1 hypothetical protein [Zobellia uliginosa]